MSLFTRLFEIRIPPKASMLLEPGNSASTDVSTSLPNDAKIIQRYNDTRPDNPITHTSALGDGSEGKVFKTKNGVVKFTNTSAEHNVADMLSKLPKFNSLPATYQQIRTNKLQFGGALPSKGWGLEDPKSRTVFAIEKEDLHDLDPLHPMVPTHDATSRHIDDLNNISRDNPKKLLHNKLKAWRNSALRSEEIPDEDKKHLKHFAHGLRRMLRFGLIPDDIGAHNVGRRSDGSFALRDLGYYGVKDDIPKLPPERKEYAAPITKPVEKLKILRKR